MNPRRARIASIRKRVATSALGAFALGWGLLFSTAEDAPAVAGSQPLSRPALHLNGYGSTGEGSYLSDSQPAYTAPSAMTTRSS